MTDNYTMVQGINRELQLIGGLLMSHKSKAVYHVGEETENVTLFQPTDTIQAITGGNMAAGQFEDGYWLLVNKNYEQFSEFMLTLAECSKVIHIDKRTGAERIIRLDRNRCTLLFQPGDAELLRIEK